MRIHSGAREAGFTPAVSLLRMAPSSPGLFGGSRRRQSLSGPCSGQPWAIQGGCLAAQAVVQCQGLRCRFSLTRTPGRTLPPCAAGVCQTPASRLAAGSGSSKGMSAKADDKSTTTASNCSPQMIKKKKLLCVLKAQVCPIMLQSRPALCGKLGFFQQNKLLKQRFETQEAGITEQLPPCPLWVPSLL